MIEIVKLLKNAMILHKNFGEGLISSVLVNDDNDINALIYFDNGKIIEIDLRYSIENNSLSFIDETINAKFNELKHLAFPSNGFLGLQNVDLQTELAIIHILRWYENKEIYDRLITKVDGIIQKDFNTGSISELEKKYLYFALAWIAFNNYNGKFWPHVSREFPLYSNKINDPYQLDNTIRKRISEQAKYQDSRHITSVLVHAGVSKFFFNGFINLAYDIFEINFDYYIDEDEVDDIIAQCVAGLVKIMDLGGQGGDNLQLNTTRKTYMLSEYTKLAFKHYSSSIAHILKMVLELIHFWYYDKNNENAYPNVIVDAFIQWTEQNKNIKTTRTFKERIGRPEFRFNSDNLSFYLYFPPFRLKDIDLPVTKELTVTLNINGEKIYLDDSMYRIEEKIGYYVVNIGRYLLKTFPRNLSFEIKYEDKVITQSSVIERNFIIFNGQGKEISNNREYKDVVYVVFPATANFTKSESINIVQENNNYKIVAFVPELDKIYKCDDDIISFTNLLKPGIHGDEPDDLEAFIDDINIKVYKSLFSYVFETRYEPEELLLKINHQTYEVKDLIFEKNNKDLIYNYKIDLSNLPINNNLTSITIVEKKTGTQINKPEKFLLDTKLEWLIIDSKKPLIKGVLWTSHFFKEQVAYDNFDFSKHKLLINTFKIGGHEIRYEINPPIKRYKWEENDDWEILNEIELKGRKTIYFSNGINTIKLFNTNRIDLELVLSPKNVGEEIIFDLTPLDQLKVDHDIIYMDLFSKDRVISNVKVYINTFVVSHNFIHKSDDKILATFNIKNFDDNNLKLVVLKDNAIFKEINIATPQAYITHLLPFQNYTVKIDREKKSIFASSSSKNIYETKFYFRDLKKLAGKSFYISKVFTYWVNDKKQISYSELDYKNVVIKIIERIKQNPNKFINFDFENNIVYRCSLRKVDRYRLTSRFKYLDEVYIEMNRDEKSALIDFDIVDKGGDGLLLSADKKRYLIDNEEPDSGFSVDYMVINLDEGEFR